MPYKILLVDDHKIIADGMKLFINNIENFEVIGWAGTGQDALTMTQTLKPDLVILDYRLPDYDGIELIPELLAISEDTKIILLTSFQEADLVVRAINAGAKGYLTKNVDEHTLKYILKSVLEDNKTWLDPTLTSHFMSSVNQEYKKIDTSLTKEEKYLVSLVAQGKSNKDISKLFFISDQTIKSHLTKLYKKLGLRSRSEVAMYAIKHNVI